MKKIFFIILFITISLFSSEVEEGLEFYKNNDYDKAFKILSKYENKNDPIIFYELAFMINEGLGTNKNINKSKDLFKKAHDIFIKEAQYGNIESMSYLADLYYNGYGITKDLNKSFYWHLKAAEGGDIYSMKSVGYMYEYGEGVSENNAMAKYWYEQALNLGDKEVKTSLADYYLNIQDIASSQEWLEKAVEDNNPYAIGQLAGYYKRYANNESNQGIKLKLLKNRYLLLKKLEKINNEKIIDKEEFNQNIINDFENTSLLNFKDHWYFYNLKCENEALKKDHSNQNVEYCLKTISYFESLDKLTEKELYYLEQSYFNSGIIYQWSIQNHKKAFEMYKKSHDLGFCQEKNSCDSALQLGYYYATGQGSTEKNLSLAYKYLKLAVKYNNESAKKNLDNLCVKNPEICIN